MNIVVFLVLLVVLIFGIFILKNLIKIIALVAVLCLFLWFLDSNGIIEIRNHGDNISLTEGKNAPPNIYKKESK